VTAQVPDFVQHQGKRYDVVGVSGEGLFRPSDWGMDPTPTSTACWRGFVALYKVEEDRLYLDQLEIGVAEAFGKPAIEPVRVFGTLPQEQPGGYEAHYRFEDAVVPFIGGLLLGDQFLHEFYVHMGFHPAWKYEEVLELVFREGHLERTIDHSERIAEIRSEIASGSRPDPDGSPDQLDVWIHRTFQLDYGRSQL
jgi:hypothetical protein